MKVGIFHPTLNGCGGAELVALNIMNSLKDQGHQTVVLTNERIDQDKIQSIFGERAKADSEIVFPLEPFPVTDLHNVYTDAIRTLFLKSQCDVLIDTHSNAILPGADITYIHFPLFGRLQGPNFGKFRRLYYVPYLLYERRAVKNPKRLILSNSQYTVNTMARLTNANAHLLYPPISEVFYTNQSATQRREDVVVSVSRISSEKRLTLIPRIAALTNKKIRYLIVGIVQSSQELNKIYEQIEKNRVTDRVEVLTNVSREKLLIILKTAKIFLHLAEGEHFGMSIVEAMASGCVPIVHNSGGPRESVPRRFRFGTLEEAAEKIDEIALKWTPQLAMSFIEKAQPFSRQNFTKEFSTLFNTHIQSV